MRNIFNNINYLEGYRVFCLSDVELKPDFDDRKINYYEIGDMIPTSGYTYIYGENLMIFDGINKKIHVIYNSRYVEIISVNNGTIQVPTDSFFSKFLRFYSYNSIDIYGNFLDIDDITDIMTYFVVYPTLEVNMEHNNYAQNLKNEDDSIFILDNTIKSNYSNSTIAKSQTNIKISDLNESLNFRNPIRISTYLEYINNSINKYMIKNSIMNKVNYLLLNIRLLYKVVNLNLKKPFIYWYKDDKNFTHIEKIYNSIKEFIDNNTEEELTEIIDIIFRFAQYEEEYEDFIISSISISIDSLL